MPYYMEESKGSFCVFKEGVDVPLECYDDQRNAEDYLTALNIATADEETKAEDDTYTPPEAVADNARMALEVRAEKPASEQGMTLVGLARANQLADRRPVSVATLRRMLSYFERHEVDKEGATWDEQGKGWQAWMGWGGDEGWAWAKEIIAEVDMEEMKASRRHSEADMKRIRALRKQLKAMIEICIELGDDGAEDEMDDAAEDIVEGADAVAETMDEVASTKSLDYVRTMEVEEVPSEVKAFARRLMGANE